MQPPPSHDRRPPSALERRSEPLVQAINALPPAVPVLVIFGLVVLGGLLGRWGAIPMGLALLVLCWILAVGWRRLTTPERFMRVAVIVFIAALTVVKAAPR